MLFKRYKRELAEKEVLISKSKEKFNKNVDTTNRQLDKINKVLSNGISLRIYHSTGHK